MSDTLKELVEKSRNSVKTQGEIVEGEGRETINFSDGTDVGFENGNEYTPSKDYTIKSPYESEGFAEKANQAVERNKSN